MIAELVLLEEFKPYPQNTKSAMGANYARGLDASIEEHGFSGSMIVTPRCSAESAPELAEAFGDDNKFIIADGHSRIDRIAALGYRWVLCFPQPATDDAEGLAATLQAILASGPDLVQRLNEKVRAGEKIAEARVNPNLNTPEALASFNLVFDSARAKPDEKKRNVLIEQLLAAGRKPEAVGKLAIISSALITGALDAQKQREREAREAEEKRRQEEAAAAAIAAGKKPPSPRAPVKRPIRQELLKVPWGPLHFTPEASKELEDVLRQMKSYLMSGMEGRMLGMVKYVEGKLGDSATRDMTLEAMIEGAARHLAASRKDLGEDDDDE